MNELGKLERDTFEKENSDLNWYKGKQAKHLDKAAGSIGKQSACKVLFQFKSPLLSYYSFIQLAGYNIQGSEKVYQTKPFS